eukprot:scaffold7337_cov220-Pinguiococcus_pyrenoidosus.AAC.9
MSSFSSATSFFASTSACKPASSLPAGTSRGAVSAGAFVSMGILVRCFAVGGTTASSWKPYGATTLSRAVVTSDYLAKERRERRRRRNASRQLRDR